jgi:hypothetical protein
MSFMPTFSLQSTLDITYPVGVRRAEPYIDECLILGVNYSCFIVVGAKNAVSYIES